MDGFQGPQPEEVIRELLQKVLPKEEELKLAQAQERCRRQRTDALPLLKDAWREQSAQRYRSAAG